MSALDFITGAFIDIHERGIIGFRVIPQKYATNQQKGDIIREKSQGEVKW